MSTEDFEEWDDDGNENENKKPPPTPVQAKTFSDKTSFIASTTAVDHPTGVSLTGVSPTGGGPKPPQSPPKSTVISTTTATKVSDASGNLKSGPIDPPQR
jgi:hypothetical protein